MIVKKFLFTGSITFITLFMCCSPCSFISLLQTNSETPLKIILISDCTITSIPDRQFEENISLNVIGKLKHALKSEIKNRGNVEFINEIDNLGVGPDRFKQSSLFENHCAIDSVISATGVNDSIQYSIQKIIRYICRKGYFCLIDSITGFDLNYSFSSGTAFQRIQLLKTVFNADYCIVNSIYGTVRRKNIPTGVKVGVAVATGIVSLLSPFGGAIVIPGDETEFKTYSFLINLSSGRVEWIDRYFSWQLGAVENVDETHWAQKTLKNFDIQKKVCQERKSRTSATGENPL